MAHRKKKQLSKGERLGWPKLKDVSYIKLADVLVPGIKFDQPDTSDDQKKNFLIQ